MLPFCVPLPLHFRRVSELAHHATALLQALGIPYPYWVRPIHCFIIASLLSLFRRLDIGVHEENLGDGQDAGCCLSLCTCSCFQRLVSKKKRRFMEPYVDLDLVYVTDRIIAMGFPSVGCETMFRNSAVAEGAFLSERHPTQTLVFNLCIEDARAYGPDRLPNQKVCRIGFMDHNPP